MTAAVIPPSFWQRRVVAPIVLQLTQGVTPEKIALTLALGLACGLLPFLGFTTALCFAVAFLLRLNQPIIHIVNQLLWPVHLSMMAVYINVGARLYGTVALPFDLGEVSRIFWASQREFWTRFGLVGVQALTAWVLSVPFLIGLVYFSTLPLLRKLASTRVART